MESLGKTTRKLLRNWLNSQGVDFVPYNPERHPLARRIRIIEDLDIDLIVDVGANTGQFALELRRLGYKGRIASFEPLVDTFKVLQSFAQKDSLWECHPYALGALESDGVLNIAGNIDSSSLLQMMPKHVEVAPHTAYVDQQAVKIKTLDQVFPSIRHQSKHSYLKIDTQGFEMQVLEGGQKTLQTVACLQLEMSLVPLYDGETTFLDMCRYLADKGFEIIALEPGFAERATGQLLQVDGIFRNRSIAVAPNPTLV